MDHDGGLDAQVWPQHVPAEVVAMVRQAIANQPKPRTLRQALRRAQVASGDDLTRQVADRCHDRDYANDFGKALLRAEVTR